MNPSRFVDIHKIIQQALTNLTWESMGEMERKEYFLGIKEHTKKDCSRYASRPCPWSKMVRTRSAES